jgi:hypothetical protein
LCKILIKKKKYLFFAYEYNDMKNFFSKISYTNIKKRFLFQYGMKRKGQHAEWVEEVGILGSSPDTKLKKRIKKS